MNLDLNNSLAISIKELTKTYGEVYALDNVSIDINTSRVRKYKR